MVELYLSPSCTSCRKARAWLNEHKVSYNEHNIFTQPMSADALREILSKTENGTDDIISMRSKIFQKLNIDVDQLSVNELIDLTDIVEPGPTTSSLSSPQPTSIKLLAMATDNRQRSITGLPVVVDIA